MKCAPQSRRFAALLGATALAVALSAPALAQDTTTVPAEPQTVPEEAPQGGDIIVRGLRRDEALQDTPAAITAFTSQSIENAGIEKPADFMALTSCPVGPRTFSTRSAPDRADCVSLAMVAPASA